LSLRALADRNDDRVKTNHRLAMLLGLVAVAFYVIFLILEA